MLKYINRLFTVNLNLQFLDRKSISSVIKSSFVVIFFYSIISPIFVLHLIDSNIENMKSQIRNNIYEYEELDLNLLTSITHSDYVLKEVFNDDKNSIINIKLFKKIETKIDKHKHLVIANNETKHLFEPLLFNKHNYKNWYLSEHLDFIIICNTNFDIKYAGNSRFYLNIGFPESVITTIMYMLMMSTIFLFLVIIVLIRTAVKIRIADIIAKTGNEALLATKNTIKFTESFHHEVKTPLAVIVNTVDKFEMMIDTINNEKDINKIKEYVKTESKQLEQLIPLIKLNFGSIYKVLERMKVIKATKHSNGNLSLYEVINNSFIGLQVHFKDTKYTYKIDSKLKLLTSGGELSNEDMLNISTNHIRNALEAGASHVQFKLAKYNNLKQMGTIFIADNGNGIPKNVQQLIYLPDFSTKKMLKNTGDNEGMGMYLCKAILKEIGGDEFISESNNKGTVFSLTIPAKDKILISKMPIIPIKVNL